MSKLVLASLCSKTRGRKSVRCSAREKLTRKKNGDVMSGCVKKGRKKAYFGFFLMKRVRFLA